MTDQYKYGVEIYNKETIHVSPKGSVCPMCGEYFDDIEIDIVCGNCGDFERCYDCDCVTHEGDRVWVESISAYVCDCCSENYYYCDRCGEYHIEEDIVHVRGYYNNRWNEHSIDHTCRWCVDHADDINTCPSCGEYVKDNHAREDGTCQECPELPVEDEDEAV